MNQPNYVNNQEFRKVFGQEIIEAKQECDNPFSKSLLNSSLTNITKNVHEQQLSKELAESTKNLKQLERQTPWSPILFLLAATLPLLTIFIPWLLGQETNHLITLAAFTFLTINMFTNVFDTKKDKMRIAEYENNCKLRKKLIKQHFNNNETIQISSIHYLAKRGKITINENGTTNIYKFKTVIDPVTKEATVEARKVS